MRFFKLLKTKKEYEVNVNKKVRRVIRILILNICQLLKQKLLILVYVL